MDQGLNGNTYVIDLSHVKTAADIVFDLSSVLDGEEARSKRICLKLGEIELNQAQILSIKSLINSINSTLSYVDTESKQTESAALALGVIITNSDSINEQEPEMTYKSADEIDQSSEEVQEEQVEESVEQETQEEQPTDYYEEGPVIPSTPRGYDKIEVEENVEEVQEEQVSEEVEQNVEVEENQEIEVSSEEDSQEGIDAIFNSEQKLESIFDTSVEEEKEVVQEASYATEAEEEKEYSEEDYEIESFATKYIKQTVRSGQVVSYEGNIVIIGDCHPGSEITAAGDVTVWGVLGGIAQAGSNGNSRARIRALKMNAIQLRISDCYARRPDALNTIYVEKTNDFTPEEARIVNNEIVIFKIND